MYIFYLCHFKLIVCDGQENISQVAVLVDRQYFLKYQRKPWLCPLAYLSGLFFNQQENNSELMTAIYKNNKIKFSYLNTHIKLNENETFIN